MTISPAYSEEQISMVRDLLLEYATMREMDEALGDFDKELRELPGKYSPPGGCLLIAIEEDIAMGVIAFRKLDDSVCEMKRMYVPEKHRGQGIGKALVTPLIAGAIKRGYSKMRLDTHPWMTSARKLYTSFGFLEIGRYNNNPIAGIKFFELDLLAGTSHESE